jgi:hypothetical protein
MKGKNPMLRKELIERLTAIRSLMPEIVPSLHSKGVVSSAAESLRVLLEDIEADGVLDVQAPPEVAKHMDLKTFTQDQSAQSRRQAAIKIVSSPGGERLIIESQKTILHGLRALLWKADSNAVAGDVQDQMGRCHDYLNATARGR